mmetsp:Transcript_68822/g.222411  ORF Transcript_68822/g.222411 Transcript_68822/m.222411 type:complete len:299 (+) Transcript_68822:1095-1991(+)
MQLGLLRQPALQVLFEVVGEGLADAADLGLGLRHHGLDTLSCLLRFTSHLEQLLHGVRFGLGLEVLHQLLALGHLLVHVVHSVVGFLDLLLQLSLHGGEFALPLGLVLLPLLVPLMLAGNAYGQPDRQEIAEGHAGCASVGVVAQESVQYGRGHLASELALRVGNDLLARERAVPVLVVLVEDGPYPLGLAARGGALLRRGGGALRLGDAGLVGLVVLLHAVQQRLQPPLGLRGIVSRTGQLQDLQLLGLLQVVALGHHEVRAGLGQGLCLGVCCLHSCDCFLHLLRRLVQVAGVHLL